MNAKNANCFECGQPSEHDHHVVPRSLGGTKTVPLCLTCHGKVHGRKLNHRELTTAALHALRAAGRLVGNAPFGFRVADDGTTLVEHAPEQAILARVAELHATGLSIRRVVAALLDEGIRGRTGKPMAYTQVRRLLPTIPRPPREREPYECEGLRTRGPRCEKISGKSRCVTQAMIASSSFVIFRRRARPVEVLTPYVPLVRMASRQRPVQVSK